LRVPPKGRDNPIKFPNGRHLALNCDILASVDGDMLAQDLIELIEYSYQ
jgi:hypothetical protein